MEKVPRKKARKGWKKTTLLLILAWGALAAGAGAYFLRPGIELPERAEPEEVMLLSRSLEEIVSVAIAPREGVAYPLVRQGDGFVLLGREQMPLRESAMEKILAVVTDLPAEEVVLDTAGEENDRLQIFGLDQPWVRLTVGYADGEKAEIRIGDEAPDEDKPQRYCMRGGDSRVYTILTDDANAFSHDVEYLRDFEQISLDASLLDRIQLSGAVEFSAVYTPSGWQMEEPFAYPLSATRMNSLLNRIGQMGFEACLGPAEERGLKEWGLDQPVLTVTLTQAPTVITGENQAGETVSLPVPEKKYCLQMGRETGKSGVYLLWEGQVFRGSNFLFDFWKTLSVDSMLLREPINFLVNNLTGLTFQRDGKKAAYAVQMVESVTENNRIATDEYGNILYDCAVRRAGETQEMDAEAFLSWYRRLASLTAGGVLPADYAVSGAPRATIQLENDHLKRTIELYPYDALHDAIAVDGVTHFFVEKDWLEGVSHTP